MTETSGWGGRQIVHKWITPEQMITSMIGGLAHILTDITLFRSMVGDKNYHPDIRQYFQSRVTIVTKFLHNLFVSYTSEHGTLRDRFSGDISIFMNILGQFPRPLGHSMDNEIVMRSKIAAELFAITMACGDIFERFQLYFPKTSEVIDNLIEGINKPYFERRPIEIFISGTPADEFFAQHLQVTHATPDGHHPR